MKAMTQDRYGDGDVLRLAEVADPCPKDDEVLVRVHAAGVDRGAWHLMTGLPLIGRPAMGWRRPRNPIRGMELAGVVERTGRKVTDFALGDEVFGCGSGTFAELARARAGQLTRKPANVTFEQAAACPISAVTALQGLRDGGRIRAGMRVLILGAGGGVGTFAVQLARHFGAEVTGVGRPAKTELIRSLGAQTTVTGRYDLILDTAGLRPLPELRALLTPTGSAVLIGGEGGPGRFLQAMDRGLRAVVMSPFVRQRRLVGFLSLTRRADLDTIAGLLTDGTLRPVLDQVFPLAEAAGAMHRLASGEVRGKVVVTVV
jgi:NADPH:quinone reductase-like Zn-dependent oxidoreductase